MTPFQIIMMLAAGFFAYQVYVYIQGIDEDAEPKFTEDEKMIETAPTPEELIQEADEAFMDDDLVAARVILDNVVQHSPRFAEARNKLAFVLSKLDDKDGAKEQYEESLRIDDNDDMTHNALADLLVSMDEDTKAEEHYKKALSIDDDYEVTWFNYANLMLKLKKEDEAKKMFEKALEINAEFEPAAEALEALK